MSHLSLTPSSNFEATRRFRGPVSVEDKVKMEATTWWIIGVDAGCKLSFTH